MTGERRELWLPYNEVFGPLETVDEPESPEIKNLSDKEKSEALNEAIKKLAEKKAQNGMSASSV